ncbi:MAG: hypothetical protein WD969_14135 [Paracoccaceae bacterium]
MPPRRLLPGLLILPLLACAPAPAPEDSAAAPAPRAMEPVAEARAAPAPPPAALPAAAPGQELLGDDFFAYVGGGTFACEKIDGSDAYTLAFETAKNRRIRYDGGSFSGRYSLNSDGRPVTRSGSVYAYYAAAHGGLNLGGPDRPPTTRCARTSA